MKKNIALSIPNFCGNESKYVEETIKTAWVSTGGKYITDFENAVASYCGSEHAVAVQNGTAGIHLSLIACGVKINDYVIVPTLTFIASVNPVRYVGAEPIFMDCDDSLCIDPHKLEEFLKNECEIENNELRYKKDGRRVSSIIIVDVFGNPADKEKIVEISKKYKLKVIEDSCESIGSICEYGKYDGKHMGVIGDVGIYSFNGNKIITTGGGGMIVTNDEKIAKTCRYLSTQAKDDLLYFVHNHIGYNYRMTNTQAALGLAQLELLEQFIEIKSNNYYHYKNRIEDETKYKILDFRKNTRPNYWFYSLLTENAQERDNLIKYFEEKGIQSRPIWYLISELEPYKSCITYKIEKAKYYWQRVVNLPCSTNLTTEEVNYVVDKLKEYR